MSLDLVYYKEEGYGQPNDLAVHKSVAFDPSPAVFNSSATNLKFWMIPILLIPNVLPILRIVKLILINFIYFLKYIKMRLTPRTTYSV